MRFVNFNALIKQLIAGKYGDLGVNITTQVTFYFYLKCFAYFVFDYQGVKSPISFH